MKVFLDREGILEMIKLAEQWSVRDEVLLRIMANTGLRGSDVLGLKKSDVQDEDGIVRDSVVVKTKKTGVTAHKRLSNLTRERLAIYLRDVVRYSKWLFPAPVEFGEHHISRMTAHRIFKRYLKAMHEKGANLRGAATHTLRRSVASLISESEGIEAAGQFLEHRSIASTMHYLNKHKLQKRADKVIDSLNI